MIFAHVDTGVAAFRAEDRDLSFLRPAVDRIIVRVTEEQISRCIGRGRDPHGSLSEEKATSEFFEFGVRRHNRIQIRIYLDDLGCHELRRTDVIPLVEVECSGSHPYEITGWIREGTVDAEDGKLNPLTRFGVAGQDDAVRGVESLDQLTTGLSQYQGEFSIDPHFSVVVDGDLEDDGRAGRIERADLVGNRDGGPVPIKTEAPGRPPLLQLCRV